MRTRRLLLRQGLRTRSGFSPPSHSLLFVGRTRRITQYTASGMRRIKTNSALPDRCFGRFRCVKNNIQLFLTCYISPLKNILLLVRHCRYKIVVVPGHVFHQALHLGRVGSAVGFRRNISVPQFLKRTSHKLTSL